MIGWKEVSVSDLGRVITGNTPPRKNPELYGNHTIFIKPTDISEGKKYTYNPEECYSESGFKKYKNSLIPKGATCVVTIGSIGKKMTKAHCDCFINQAVNAVVPNELYDEEFVYYVLKYNLEQLKGLDSGTASGRENVSKSSFSSIKLNVPVDKLVQTKIGQILSAYDDLIENNLKRIKLLEELAQRTYEEWFVKFRVNGAALEMDAKTGLPAGWKRKKLPEIADIGFGFAFKANQFNSNKIGTPIIRIRNIPNSVTNDFTTEKVDKKYLVEIGDLLVGMDGEFHINNWSGPEAYLVQRSCNIGTRNRLYHGYLSQAVVKPIKYFEATISGATVAHLGKKHLDTIEIIVPTRQFDFLLHAFNNWLTQKLNLAVQNRNLKEARDILLPRLMNGMINIAVTETKPTAKTIQLDAPTRKQATPQFKEAILISLLTLKFGSEKYPLGRMRYTKLSYLFHRHADNQIKDYLRKAAGPYNPKTKYGGPEKIAHDNGYVADHKSGQLTGFLAGPNIEKAKSHFESYWNIEYLNWLEAQFKYKSNDDLELFATVDNSLIELNKKNQTFTVEAVKKILQEEPEWKAKLKREIFNDINIQRAITYLPTIFQY